MKRFGFLVLLFWFALSIYSQNNTFAQKIEKKRDKLYLFENNEYFEVDLTVVTVKLINGEKK